MDAFHQAAIAAGGTCNGAPGLRPQYHKDYYGAFVIDPMGNNVEMVRCCYYRCSSVVALTICQVNHGQCGDASMSTWSTGYELKGLFIAINVLGRCSLLPFAPFVSGWTKRTIPFSCSCHIGSVFESMAGGLEHWIVIMVAAKHQTPGLSDSEIPVN